MELASPEISKQENQNANPWPIIDSTQKCENSFENNFTRAQKDELNENGLSLPDYTHHLNLLEKKLLKFRQKNSKVSKDFLAKEIIKSLASRKATFYDQQNMGENSGDVTLEDHQDHGALQNNPVLNALGRKFFPQLQALDSEELEKLLKSDLLNSLYTTNLEAAKDEDVVGEAKCNDLEKKSSEELNN